MCSLPSDLATSSCGSGIRRLPLGASFRSGRRLAHGRRLCSHTWLCLLLTILGLHLYDLARPCWRRRQCEVVFSYDRPTARRRSFPPSINWRQRSVRAVGRVGAIDRWSRRARVRSIDLLLVGCGRQIQCWPGMIALFTSDVAAGARCGRSVGAWHISSNNRPPVSDRDRDWPAGVEDVLGVGSQVGRLDDGGHLSLPHDDDDRAAACAWPEVEASQRVNMVKAEESAQCKHVSSVACHHSRIKAVARLDSRQRANQKRTCMRPCPKHRTPREAYYNLLSDFRDAELSV